MKKIFSFFLAVILVLSCSVLASAEDVKEYIWSQPAGGLDWKIEEVDADFWLPETFLLAELSDQDLADGCIGFLTTRDNNKFIAFFYTKMGDFSLEAYLGYFIQNGIDAKLVTINGIPAVLQLNQAADQAILMFQTQEGNLFQAAYHPLSDEALYEQVFSSIRPSSSTEESSEPASAAPVNPVSSLISK